ncbi:MAG: flagellar basal body rod protein FlgB [Proteobacteria bacterium]|nr:flagellar basal body rod protein FlgB [Pseudomonadota bacterium]
MTEIFSIVNDMARAFDFHLSRQNLISANIANVDTPGYAPKEMIRADASGDASFSLSLATTDSKHISFNVGGSGSEFEVFEEHNVIPGNDQNYVSMDHEMTRLAANSVRYQVVERIVSKHLGMLRYASQGGR